MLVMNWKKEELMLQRWLNCEWELFRMSTKGFRPGSQEITTHGSNSVCHLFWYGPCPKNGSYIFKWLGGK